MKLKIFYADANARFTQNRGFDCRTITTDPIVHVVTDVDADLEKNRPFKYRSRVLLASISLKLFFVRIASG